MPFRARDVLASTPGISVVRETTRTPTISAVDEEDDEEDDEEELLDSKNGSSSNVEAPGMLLAVYTPGAIPESKEEYLALSS